MTPKPAPMTDEQIWDDYLEDYREAHSLSPSPYDAFLAGLAKGRAEVDSVKKELHDLKWKRLREHKDSGMGSAPEKVPLSDPQKDVLIAELKAEIERLKGEVLGNGWVDDRHLKRIGHGTLCVQPEADTIGDTDRAIPVTISRRKEKA